MVTTGRKFGKKKKDAKENQEISHNLLNEFNIKAINSETRYR